LKAYRVTLRRKAREVLQGNVQFLRDRRFKPTAVALQPYKSGRWIGLGPFEIKGGPARRQPSGLQRFGSAGTVDRAAGHLSQNVCRIEAPGLTSPEGLASLESIDRYVLLEALVRAQTIYSEVASSRLAERRQTSDARAPAVGDGFPDHPSL
jgi:hypothetical protein